MLINFSKKDLVIENNALVTGIKVLKPDSVGNYTSSPISLDKLCFEGMSGFNDRYVKPFLQFLYSLLSKKMSNLYKVIKVAGNLHNDDSIHTAEFFIIKSVSNTNFLFKVLKSFAISLTDLRLGYENEDGKETLYLDKRILRTLSSLDDGIKTDLIFYLYCLIKLCKAINDTRLTITADESGNLLLLEQQLNDLYANYGKISDEVSLECISLKEDVHFGDIQYYFNEYMQPSISDTKYSSTFVYNVLKTEKAERLCIINVTTKEYFIIDLDKATIYTNNELMEYNTFESIEWVPNLVVNMVDVIPNYDYYRVKYLTLNQLLNTKEPEMIISNNASAFEALLDHYPYINENNNMKLYEGYFKGTKIINEGSYSNKASEYEHDEYAQELYKQVQPYYEKFDLKDLTSVVKGVANGTVYSMLFEGESGTGKSTAARVIASRCGIPFVALNCSTNIEEADIFGSMIPNPTKKSAEDPEFIWQDGPLTKAIRYGYVGIIEELGFGRPGVLGKINSLLDESRQIDLPNGEVLKAHPNFRIIATTNIGYEGTNRLNKALVNRFEICKKFVDLDEKEMKEVILNRTGYSNMDKVNKILEVYRMIKKYSNENNLGLVISVRQLLNIFKQGMYYRTAKDAVYNLLINQAFLEEPEHLEFFTNSVLSVLDLSFKL